MGSSSITYENRDIIARLQEIEGTSSLFKVTYLDETKNFALNILNPYLEVSILKNVVNNLWKTHLYNQEYISYLLNLSSRDEFVEKAKSFAESFQLIGNDQLCFAANLLLHTLNQSLTSDELSLMLNVDTALINNCNLLIEYNPDGDQ